MCVVWTGGVIIYVYIYVGLFMRDYQFHPQMHARTISPTHFGTYRDKIARPESEESDFQYVRPVLGLEGPKRRKTYVKLMKVFQLFYRDTKQIKTSKHIYRV